jgi:hypothetical protein
MGETFPFLKYQSQNYAELAQIFLNQLFQD